MKAMPAKTRTDSENNYSYHFDKMLVKVGVCVKVQKMHLKARSLPPYFYIKLTPSSYPLFIHACNLILKVRNYSSLG